MAISENLKELRKKNGLSQREFANKLGINMRTYASYERGERDVSTAVLLNICQSLNISSDVLLGNDTEPYDKSPEFSPKKTFSEYGAHLIEKESTSIKQDRSAVIERINSLTDEQFEKFAAKAEGYLDGLEDQ